MLEGKFVIFKDFGLGKNIFNKFNSLKNFFRIGRISCVGVRVVVFTGTPCVETKTLKLMQWKQHNIMK